MKNRLIEIITAQTTTETPPNTTAPTTTPRRTTSTAGKNLKKRDAKKTTTTAAEGNTHGPVLLSIEMRVWEEGMIRRIEEGLGRESLKLRRGEVSKEKMIIGTNKTVELLQSMSKKADQTTETITNPIAETTKAITEIKEADDHYIQTLKNI